MYKRIFACLVAGALAFTSFGAMAAGEETPTEISTEAGAETGVLSDDIYSFEALIDGELYKFPMSYQDFTAMGWTYKDDDTIEIQPNGYSPSERFAKGNLEIYASIINMGINTVPLSQCLVGGFSMDEWQYKDAPDTTVELPKGIQYGVSSLEDVTAAYGTPSDTYEGDLYTKLSYDYDSYQNVELYVSKETGVVNEISLRNFVADTESIASAAAQVSSEPTEEVLAYQTPAELGDDILSFTVEYAGDLYQLPAPVSVFEANGWTVKEDSDSIVAGKDFGWVYMIKDNQEFRTIARNYNGNATTISNCFVTSVESDVNSTNLPIALPGGIVSGMTRDELLAALSGMDYETDDTSSEMFTYYTMEGPESSLDGITILVRNEEDVVTSIEVSYDPKTLSAE